MPATNFPDGLTAGGIPVLPGGAPFFTGRWFFVDAVNGSDAYDGSAETPMRTIPAAYALMTEGNNDVLVLVGKPTTAAQTTGTFRLSATLDWAKAACHMIGMCAPTSVAQRARISTATGATANINPLMTLSAADCYWGNFSFFQGVGEAATDEKLINITGDRNYFNNIQFGGMGHANGAARAGSYIIKLDDGDENTFQSCVIGLETVQRGAANASVVVTNGSQRNQFYDCQFMMSAKTDTSPLYLDLSAANCLNGSSMTFRRCLFQHLTGISGSTVPAVVASLNAAINGVLVMDQCTTNATKWAAATTQMIISGFAIGNGFSSGRFATAADS